MAGLEPASGPLPAPAAGKLANVPSLRHFTTVAWLRWRIFMNSFRAKGATGELIVKIISYPILAGMILGPSIAAGIGGYYLVSSKQLKFLSIPLWLIFGLWQIIGMNTSATGPSFDLASLVRFPIRYRDYLLIRLSFGLLDPPTLAGVCCLAALSLGIGIADVSLFPWAALLLLIYAICNILFTRMVYTWLERWLAKRRTRELVTGLILIGSLGAQFASQFFARIATPGRHGHHPQISPFWRSAIHVGSTINWLLPPGLTATSIDHMHLGSLWLAAAALAGLLAYTGLFLLVFQLRMSAEFRGENLSEAPAAPQSRAVAIKERAASRARASSSPTISFLPVTLAAVLGKELRYLLRSGPKLYTLVMPVFVVLLFSVRTAGASYAGVTRHSVPGMLFAYGCAYTNLIFIALIYNSLGSDGAGVQFYFISPVPIRDVMLAKNLLVFGIFAVEIAAIYVASAFIASPASLDLTAATVAWCLFTLFISLIIGNVRSIASPRMVDLARVRGQNVTGLSGLISVFVVLGSAALGALMFALCHYLLHTDFWIAAAVFAILAIGSFLAYIFALDKLDGIAAREVENLTKTLGKA